MLMQESVAMFGADGRLAATYTPQPQWTNTTSQVAITFTGSTHVYFAGKLIKQNGQNAVQDRLGSVGKYYPYGEERNSPPLGNDQVKFATYTRDSATGLDYADQRYYGSTFGRFMTPDPYKATSGGPGDQKYPLSWNRYDYVQGDPANFLDPGGRDGIPAGQLINLLVNLGFLRFDSVTVAADFEPVPYAGGGGGQELFELQVDPGSGTPDQGGAGGWNLCNLLPTGRTQGISITFGMFAGASFGAELVINYQSGQISLFGDLGFSVGTNLGAISTAYTGFVFNLSDDNGNYSGPFGVIAGGLGKFFAQWSVANGGFSEFLKPQFG